MSRPAGAIESGRYDPVAHEFESSIGLGYVVTGQPQQWVELCRNVIARTPGSHTFTQACLVSALTAAGAGDEAVAESHGLLAAADATDNPLVACYALGVYGYAHTGVDPAAAYDVALRGLRIAHDSGNRQGESVIASVLSRLAVAHGDPTDALDYLALSIRDYYDCGSFSLMSAPLAILAIIFDRLGQHEPAATISGFAATPYTRTAVPEITTTISHLREVLGDEAYDALARAGAAMANAAVVTYAFDQIDQARAQLSL